jgi:hypothetical protein
MGQHVLPSLPFAAPPGGHRGELRLLAQEIAADRGQKDGQHRRFQQAAAQGIGHRRPAPAHRFHQTGHTQAGILLKFQRIAVQVIHPAQDHVHGLRAAQGTQPDPAAGEDQVLALDQGVAQVTGEVDVFEPGLVEGTRGEQHHPGFRVLPGRQRRQARAQGLEEARQAVHAGLAVQAREDPRKHDPVLQGIARTGGGLGAVTQHPHLSVRSPGQIRGIQGQRMVRQREAVAGMEETALAEHQFRRQDALPEQVPGP